MPYLYPRVEKRQDEEIALETGCVRYETLYRTHSGCASIVNHTVDHIDVVIYLVGIAVIIVSFQGLRGALPVYLLP